jgi:hypothetical protein
MNKAICPWDNWSRQIIENKDVFFDKLNMEGGDRCETPLDSTIMHLSGITFNAL